MFTLEQWLSLGAIAALGVAIEIHSRSVLRTMRREHRETMEHVRSVMNEMKARGEGNPEAINNVLGMLDDH